MSRDPFAAHDKYGIRPSWFYRKYHEETQHILGLGETATNEAIAKGLLDPPVPLTSRGRAKGWWGWQLINYMDRRATAAQQQQAVKKEQVAEPQRRKQLAKAKRAT